MLDKEQIKQLRSEGKTYQEIANIFGVSRQRIEQVINNRKSLGYFENRLKIMIYDKFICQECNNKFNSEELEIHHINKDTNNNLKENLITLCKKCHKKWHSKQPVDNYSFIALDR